MAKDKFLSYLKYDYDKYTKKLDDLEEEIENESSKKIIASSPDVVTSSTWQNAHNEESYSDAKERMALEKARAVQSNKTRMLESWKRDGVFHRRLSFDNGNNFYLTTAKVDVDYSLDGDFILSYWGLNSDKVDTLMEKDIGHVSKANGVLVMTGDFTPHERDLINVKYKNTTGKFEFISAKNTLDGVEMVEDDSTSLINTDEFFRLKFNLAGLGDQSRALYDTNSAIIDGAAGTGKSTIALQKLKSLHEKKNISQNNMSVIVKNKQAIPHFQSLLSSDVLALNEVKIYYVDEFLNNLSLDSTINADTFMDLKSNADSIKKNLENMIQLINLENIQKHFSVLLEYIGKEFFLKSLESMLEEIKNDKDKVLEINDLKAGVEDINQSLLDEDIDDEQKLDLIDRLKAKTRKVEQLSGENYKKALLILEDDIEKLSTVILTDIVSFNYASKELTSLEVLLWMKRYINFHVDKSKNEEQLQIAIEELEALDSLEEDKLELEGIKKELEDVEFYASESPNDKELKKELRELKSKYKKQLSVVKNYELLPKKKADLKEKITKTFSIEASEKRQYSNVIHKLYFTKDYIRKAFLDDVSDFERYITLCYLLDDSQVLDTLIVDEAQDYTLVELELLRFQAKRIILTGDILQNLNPVEIQSWKNILNVNDVYGVENNAGDKKLNKFDLKHNFRQTYQLANASYNFRQLLLNGGMEDIQQEYYLSEKEFNGKPYRLPTLSRVEDQHNLQSFIKEKIENITQVYSSKIPIAIIYKSENQKQDYLTIFKHYRISENIDELSELDILLVDILESKGKEFPLVVSELDSLTDSEIYLIMTRAQFELDFVSTQHICPNKNLQTLIDREWVVKENILDYEDEVFDHEDDDQVEEEINTNEVAEPIKTSVIDKLKNIVKHYGTVKQKKEEIEPSIIKDEQKYKDDFVKKLNEQESIAKNIEVVFLRKEVDKDTTRINNEIKDFLYNIYKGHCQLCGFTFRKVKDTQNSFEKFSWNDKRIVKVKKDFVSSAESLCLCRNCAANIKFGAFEPVFVEKINAIDDFENQSFEFTIQNLHSVIDEDIHEIFKEHIDFDDIFALEISLNQESKNICFTREHLLQFITFLQLEKQCIGITENKGVKE